MEPISDKVFGSVTDSLIEFGRPRMLEVFDETSCVAATRIGLDVYQFFGVTAHAIPVEVLIFNAEATRILEDEGLAALQSILEKYGPVDAGGPWSIGIGMQSLAQDLDAGHVVIGIPGKQAFLDLSLDQGARPHKAIHLKPTLFTEAKPEWFTEVGSEFPLRYPQEQGPPVTVVYSHAGQHLYRRSPNWRRQGARPGTATTFRRLTGDIIRDAKSRLMGTPSGI